MPDPQVLATEAITELEAIVVDFREIVALIEKEEGVKACTTSGGDRNLTASHLFKLGKSGSSSESWPTMSLSSPSC